MEKEELEKALKEEQDKNAALSASNKRKDDEQAKVKTRANNAETKLADAEKQKLLDELYSQHHSLFLYREL